ncbi:MAG: hypothetical protein ABIH92_02680, partial [Nanoarchaeota archaeon]
MKRWIILVFILVFTARLVSAVITGDTITGDATKDVGLNITVTAYFPQLSIMTPKNETYLTN